MKQTLDSFIPVINIDKINNKVTNVKLITLGEMSTVGSRSPLDKKKLSISSIIFR